MCIGRQGRLVMIALLWLSAVRTRYSSFVRATSPLTDETPSPSLLTSCLDLELLFKCMVYWCSPPPLLSMSRWAAAIMLCFHEDCWVRSNQDSTLHVCLQIVHNAGQYTSFLPVCFHSCFVYPTHLAFSAFD